MNRPAHTHALLTAHCFLVALPLLPLGLPQVRAAAAEDTLPEGKRSVAKSPDEKYASEEMRKLAAEIDRLAEAGKASVPRLLPFLRDIRVVSTTYHPGGKDQCGMPLMAHTTHKRVCDVAGAALCKLYAQPGAKDSEDDTVKKAISDFFRAQVLNDQAPDYVGTEENWCSKAFPIQVLGAAGCPEALGPLLDCLHHFMKKDQDWKWARGRELLGATLSALSAVGDKTAALAVLYYARHPGCDFLYVELSRCLAALGRKALPELLADIREAMARRDFSYEQLQLIVVLGDVGDKAAVPLLREFLDLKYDDQWRERDFKCAAIGALAKLDAAAEIDRIAREYPNALEGTQLTIIASLKQLWKRDTRAILQYMASGNGDYRTSVAGRVLADIGGPGDYAALKERLAEGSPEYRAIAYGVVKTIAARLFHQETEQRTREAWQLWSQFLQERRLHTPQALPVLAHLLGHSSYQVYERSLALQALGRLGADYQLPEEIAQLLVQHLEDPNKYLQFAAAGALGIMGRNDGLAAVTACLKNPLRPDEVYLEIMATKAHSQITRALHPRMTEKALAGEQGFVVALLDLAESDPGLPLKETLEALALKTTNDEWRKRARAAVARLAPPPRNRAKAPLPALEPWARERSGMRVLVDALAEGVRDDNTAAFLVREFEFCDGPTQYSILRRLARHYGKPPQQLIAETIPPRGIASAVRSGSPRELVDLLTNAWAGLPQGPRKDAIASELRSVPGDAAKHLLEPAARAP